jgi:hypothetical protein
MAGLHPVSRHSTPARGFLRRPASPIDKEVPVRSIPNRIVRPAVVLPVLLGFLLGLTAGPAAAQERSAYRDHAALTKAVQALAGANKTLVRVASIGKSRGGRDLWAIEIAGPGAVPPGKRPALLVAAGFEGDDLTGTELALAVADYLAKNASADPAVKQRLDASTVYVLPRINPDGAEGFFAPLKTGQRTNANPFDDDNDGRIDEDGPEDLNGDGFITAMRVPAAGGEYVADPEEPRSMKRADPKKGETGAFRIFAEGIDNDGDGFVNEDPPGGVDIGRNFAHEYPYFKPGAGPHMVSEAESRALMAWIVAHRNVAAILTFGESDNLIVPPTSAGRLGPARELDLVRFAEAAAAGARAAGFIQTGGAMGFGRGGRMMMGEFSMEMLTGGGSGRQQAGRQSQAAESARFMMPDRKPATTVATADYDYFKAVSDKYVEMTGIRQPLCVREPQGAFFQYGYFQFGVPSFSTPGFGLTTAEPAGPRRMGMAPPGAGESGPPAQAAASAATPGIDKQVLKWLDAEKIDGFVKWTKAKHPEFGEVEIGGFKPYATTNVPAAKLAELGSSHAKFALHLLSLFPRVKVASFEAVAHGGGLFRLKAEVENAGFWPTSFAQGQTARSVKPTMVRLGVEPGDVLSGSSKTNFLPVLAGSGGRAKYEWLIKGKAGEVVELLVQSEKGGAATARVTLK